MTFNQPDNPPWFSSFRFSTGSFENIEEYIDWVDANLQYFVESEVIAKAIAYQDPYILSITYGAGFIHLLHYP